LLKKVLKGEDLSKPEAGELMNYFMSGEAVPEKTAAILGALAVRGETYEEIAGFAETMRAKANKIEIKDKNAIDLCGTGGDGAGIFNVSTCVSFVAAGAGITVAKHGNRSVSSKSGSADVLGELGIKAESTPEETKANIDNKAIGFMFAPLYHPAMKYIGPVRKAIGAPTVFNLLGPLCNPASVTRQVLGVYDAKKCENMAKALQNLGSKNVMIIHSDDGLDELSLSAPSTIYHLKDDKIDNYKINPQELGFKPASFAEIGGGDASVNARIITEVLNGNKSASYDMVVLNSIPALIVGGKATDFMEAKELAINIIDSGKAKEALERIKA